MTLERALRYSSHSNRTGQRQPQPTTRLTEFVKAVDKQYTVTHGKQLQANYTYIQTKYTYCHVSGLIDTGYTRTAVCFRVQVWYSRV